MSRRIAVVTFAALGASTAALLIAQVQTPLRPVTATLFCLLCPGLGWAQRLRPGDLGDTLAIAAATSICLTVAVGTAMALLGVWSPVGGFLTLLAVGTLGMSRVGGNRRLNRRRPVPARRSLPATERG
jgi:hypothetical protein